MNTITAAELVASAASTEAAALEANSNVTSLLDSIVPGLSTSQGVTVSGSTEATVEGRHVAVDAGHLFAHTPSGPVKVISAVQLKEAVWGHSLADWSTEASSLRRKLSLNKGWFAAILVLALPLFLLLPIRDKQGYSPVSVSSWRTSEWPQYQFSGDFPESVPGKQASLVKDALAEAQSTFSIDADGVLRIEVLRPQPLSTLENEANSVAGELLFWNGAGLPNRIWSDPNFAACGGTEYNSDYQSCWNKIPNVPKVKVSCEPEASLLRCTATLTPQSDKVQMTYLTDNQAAALASVSPILHTRHQFVKNLTASEDLSRPLAVGINLSDPNAVAFDTANGKYVFNTDLGHFGEYSEYSLWMTQGKKDAGTSPLTARGIGLAIVLLGSLWCVVMLRRELKHELTYVTDYTPKTAV